MNRISAKEFKQRFAGQKAEAAAAGTAKAEGPPIRVTTAKGPNATEERYRTEHAVNFLLCDWRYEAITFRLPGGTLYTPDWTVWDRNTLVACIEVKGAHGHKDASRNNFKLALATWPHARWIFAFWDKARWRTFDNLTAKD